MFEQIKKIGESLGWKVERYHVSSDSIYFHKDNGFSMCAIIDDGIASSIEDEIKVYTSERYIKTYGAWDKEDIEDARALHHALKDF